MAKVSSVDCVCFQHGQQVRLHKGDPIDYATKRGGWGNGIEPRGGRQHVTDHPPRFFPSARIVGGHSSIQRRSIRRTCSLPKLAAMEMVRVRMSSMGKV
ncbi:hypothetical protein [Dyella sp.]|uniref:hypothetical protein n=1 Tax=Dyella sp. TaxID=1869338 RepID=UPI0028503DE4|nr:hypothetical protein [Dyella sp.]MDR3444467.1 hypothetical protein [Dyella sp.]